MSDEATLSLREYAMIAVGVIIVGIGLYFILPVVTLAIGAGFGLAVAVSTTGLATAGAVGSWVAPVASIGVATLGGLAAVAGMKRLADAAQDKPYDYGLPVLGMFGGLASTLAKDTGLESVVSKWLFGGIAALFIVVAGACYKRPGIGWKTTAAALYLLPPLLLLAWSLLTVSQPSLWASFGAVNAWTWIGIASLVVAGVLIGVLARLDEQAVKERGADG